MRYPISYIIFIWVPRWCSGNVDITDWMLRLFGVLSSITVNVKTVQMLFNVVWSFPLTVWTTVMRLCAELITHHIKIPKPNWNSGKFLREGYIPMKDSSASPYFFYIIFMIMLQRVVTQKSPSRRPSFQRHFDRSYCSLQRRPKGLRVFCFNYLSIYLSNIANSTSFRTVSSPTLESKPKSMSPPARSTESTRPPQ
jgi:hypothetical protein